MAGTLAVTAQSPNETRTFVCARTLRTSSRLSSLQMAPSIRHTSTFSGYSFTSITGLKTRSTFPASSMRNSSRSRNDMWQPEQPPNHTVARRRRAGLPVSGFVSISFCVCMLVSNPLLLLPRGDDELKLGPVAFHLAYRRALVEQRAGRAGHDTLADRKSVVSGK